MHIDFLEATRQGVVLFEYPAVFAVSGRADAFQLSRIKYRFQQVGSVQRSAGSGARANHRMNFINEQNGVGAIEQLFQHRLQALLEIAPVFGAGQQRAHIKCVHLVVRENIGNVIFDDSPCQSLSDSRFADSRLAYQKGIIFATAAQCLDQTFQFLSRPINGSILPASARVFRLWRSFPARRPHPVPARYLLRFRFWRYHPVVPC